jgi:hypothetical protein
MAEQAQAKLEEAQRQFNEGEQQVPPPGPATEYDQHGRPVPAPDPGPPHGDPPAPDPGPPHGDPLAASLGGTAETEPPAPPAPGVPATASEVPPAEAPEGAAPAPPAPGVPPVGDDDPNHPSYAPPPLTSGDPLAG